MSSGIALAGSALYSVTEGWQRAREQDSERRDKTARRERRARNRVRWGDRDRRGRTEKSRRWKAAEGMGWEIGEDEDIYLAASTVLKTTVVHFAELPRGTADAVTREKEGHREGNQGKKERERERERERETE